MKTESGTQPKPYRITTIGQEAIIEFAENIVSAKTEDGTKYTYDSYHLKSRATPTLEARIDKDYSAWLAKAKGIELEPIKTDPVQTKIDLLESRLAKIEAASTVKAELALKEAEPIIKDTISK
jgi:hypothetical protein